VLYVAIDMVLDLHLEKCKHLVGNLSNHITGKL
jgi:hypothetical protein